MGPETEMFLNQDFSVACWDIEGGTEEQKYQQGNGSTGKLVEELGYLEDMNINSEW